MSPKLKPLLLPQLVEEQRIVEMQRPSCDDESAYLYYTRNSSSSDLASPSPATPTFPRGHSRYSGSSSSLEFMSAACSESPVSPSTHAHNSKTKSHLPDVLEEPYEREESEEQTWHTCTCEDELCSRDTSGMSQSALEPYFPTDIDYDLGFLSDSDFGEWPCHKKRRNLSHASVNTWGVRLGSKFQGLPRWRTARQKTHGTLSPASDLSLDHPITHSRGPSSRSSSISALSRRVLDRVQDPPVSHTPALSQYGSAESITLSPPPLETEIPSVRQSIERDRSLTTTPLLPPLLTRLPSLGGMAQGSSLQPSPYQSPSIISSPTPDASVVTWYPTPPLSTKASVSSFRRKGSFTCLASDLPLSLPSLLDRYDAWSDRLGHANFTILPQPYLPEATDIDVLISFRADWDLARVNYTKHLVRTGEHYGTTSKTYALTQAKWGEVEQQWHSAEDQVIEKLATEQCKDTIALVGLRRPPEDTIPANVPRLLNTEGKFPERGDVDIVGPMTRDAVMIREGMERKNAATVWLKNLAGKVGLRR